MKRRLEETLAECLAALEGGRLGVEECLDLYPELASELEPLLRLARGLEHVYAVEPAPGFEQAARQRFLTAIARRRQRRLVPRGAVPVRRWALAALGSAALVAFVAWAGVLAFGGGGGGSETVFQTPQATGTPAPVVRNIDEQVTRIQGRLAEIQSLAEQGVAIEAPVIQQLRQDTSTLVGSLGGSQVVVPQEDVSKIGDLLASQEEILSQVKDKVAPEASADLDDTIRMAQEGQNKVDVLLAATPPAGGTSAARPSATPSPTPTRTPTATPEPTGTAAPTSTPTPSGSPSPTPSEQPTTPTPEAGGEGFSPVPTAVP